MARFGFGGKGYGPFGWRRVGRGADLVVALGFILLLAIAGAVLQYRLGSWRELAGAAQVVDGDSLRLAGEDLRLEGIDAPELRQTCRDTAGRELACGREARRVLTALMARGHVTCTIGDKDRYGRGLARCRQGETDINAELVRLGQAVAYGDFRRQEDEARAAGRGIWATRFERPQDWRRNHARR